MSRTSDRGYQRNRRRLQRNEDTCWLCGGWIDPDLKYPHPMSFSADHLQPISRGGHNRGQLRAAHLVHNLQRGNKPANAIQPPKHGRQW